MGNIILPGAYGIGTKGYVETPDGYRDAARDMVREFNAGRPMHGYEDQQRRVFNLYGVTSMTDLAEKARKGQI